MIAVSIILSVLSVFSCLAQIGIYFRIKRLTEKFRAAPRFDDQYGNVVPLNLEHTKDTNEKKSD